MSRKCAVCSLEFEPAAPKSKYCSPRCRQKVANYNRRIKNGQETYRYCEMCGEQFDVTRRNKKYCSVTCRQRSYMDQNLNEIPIPDARTCEKCGQVHHSGNRWYCPPCHTMISDHFNMAEGVDGFEYSEDVVYTDKLTDHAQYKWQTKS